MNPPSLPCEEWRPVVGWEDRYLVSNQGRLWSFATQKILTTQVNERGYVVGTFCRDNSNVAVRVHRVMALAFIPNPENKPTVNHCSGVKTENVIENLEWATKEEQMQHAIHVLRKGCGESGSGAKLTTQQVLTIRREHESGDDARITAKTFGVTEKTIRDIIRRDSWIYV